MSQTNPSDGEPLLGSPAGRRAAPAGPHCALTGQPWSRDPVYTRPRVLDTDFPPPAAGQSRDHYNNRLL